MKRRSWARCWKLSLQATSAELEKSSPSSAFLSDVLTKNFCTNFLNMPPDLRAGDYAKAVNSVGVVKSFFLGMVLDVLNTKPELLTCFIFIPHTSTTLEQFTTRTPKGTIVFKKLSEANLAHELSNPKMFPPAKDLIKKVIEHLEYLEGQAKALS